MPRSPPDPLYTLKGDLIPVHSLSFWVKSRNEKLFAGCQSGQVQLWSLQSNRGIEGLQAHCGPCINVSCFGANLITQGKGDGRVKSWHTLEGGGWAPNYTIHTRHSFFCRFSILNTDNESSSLLVCPEEDRSVAVYSTNSGEKLAKLNMSDVDANSKRLGNVMALKAFFDPSSMRPMVLIAHEGGQISVRDLFAAGKEICSLDVEEPIISLEYDPIEEVGVYGSPESNFIRKFSIHMKTGISELGSHTAITNPGISCVKLRPDSKILATGGWDGRLRFFSWQQTASKNSQSDINMMSAIDDESIHSTSKDIDKDLMPKGAIDSASANWNLPSSAKVSSLKKAMKPLAVLKHHSKAIQDVAFSDGPVESWECSCLFAAGSDDGGISLWNLYN